MKRFPLFVLLILVIGFVLSGSSADQAKSTLSKADHHQEGVFVRKVIGGVLKEFKVMPTKRSQVERITKELQAVGFKEKDPGDQAMLDKIKWDFIDTLKPGRTVLVMETPAKP